MLKLKENAVKTMADSMAESNAIRKPAAFLKAGSSEIVYLNRKLREAFGISVNPKNTPLPKWKMSETNTPQPSVKIAEIKPVVVKTDLKTQSIKPASEKVGASLIAKNNIAATANTTPKKESVLPEALKAIAQSANSAPGTQKAPLDIAAIKMPLPIAATANTQKTEEEQKRLQEEKRRKEEEEKRIKEKKAQEELLEKQRRLEEQKMDEEEKLRIKEEQRKKDEENKKLLEEQKRLQEEKALKEAEEKRRAEEEEKRRKEEEEKRIKEKKTQEELEAKKKQEEERQRVLEEQKRLQEEKALKEAEEKRRAEEEEKRRKLEEKIKEERRKALEESAKAREEKRRRLALLEMEREQKLKKEAEQKNKPEKEMLAESEPIESKGGMDLSDSLKALILKLEAKKNAFDKQLVELPSVKIPLERKKISLEGDIALIKNGELAKIESREQEIEKQEILEKEKLSQKLESEQEKAIEQKLWAIEDQRKEIEKQRWAIEDRIEGINTKIKNVDIEIDQREADASLMNLKIQNISNQIRLVKFAQEKIKLEEEMLKNVTDKDVLNPSLAAANAKKQAEEKKLKELIEKEASTSAELNIIEQKEKMAADPQEKRLAEQARWNVVATLKTIIQSKWESEERLKDNTKSAENLETKINSINEKINKTQSNITEKERQLEKDGLPVHKIRDTISAMFKENSIYVDQELLKDIIQVEEVPTTKKPASAAGEVPKTTNEVKAVAAPEAKAQPVLDAAAPVAMPKQPEPPANVIRPEQKKDEANTTPVPAAPIKNEEVSNTKKESLDGSNENDTSKEAAKNTPATASNSPWKPETKLNEISQKITSTPEPTTNKTTAPAMPAANPKISAKTVSFYREQVENSPANNIRSFPRAEFGKPEQLKASNGPELNKAISQKPTMIRPDIIGDLEVPEEKPIQKNLEDRWNVIKSSNTPGGNLAAPATTNPPQTVAPDLEPKPSGNSKLLVRALIVLVLVGIIGIILVFALTKNGNTTTVKKAPAAPVNNTGGDSKKETDDTPTTNEDDKKNTANPSTLAVISTITIYTEDLASVPTLIYPYLQTPLGSNGYYRISIQNKKDNTKVGLRQFFNIYDVKAQAAFYTSISDDFTLFVYSNNGRNRLGFVTPVTNLGSLKNAMESWEGTIQQDTNNLFKLLNRKTQAKPENNKFISGSAPNSTAYRSMDFVPASDNYSITYAFHNDKYLIFTTSKDSLVKIFDQLPK